MVTDCFDCLEEFAMAAQSGGYQLVCLRGGERQWRAAEELRRTRRGGDPLGLSGGGTGPAGQGADRGRHLRRCGVAAVSGMNTVMTDYFALAPRHARDAILPIKHPAPYR